MRNERNAGRKSKIDEIELEGIRMRIDAGESVSDIASEYGISRQALYKKLKITNDLLILDYIVNDQVSTRIEIDVAKERLHIINYALRISDRAFGFNDHPDWHDLQKFFEKQYFSVIHGVYDINQSNIICNDTRECHFNLKELIDDKFSNIVIANDFDTDKLPTFSFTKKDILYSRTDTDGYQLKALSRDRMLFVKSQAFISGVPMDDWRVEVLASEVCSQLKIPCVKQSPCNFVYGSRRLKGVYSKNFEVDGYTFVSFEGLLERSGLSSREDYFIKKNAIDKLKWCAEKMSEIGQISYEQTLKYMIDLALIDIIVGNVDRHTRNFGLFFDTHTGQYEIPLLFDNGMGLFEHDSYKDRYKSYDEAMMSVYVAPYGEDPFDMYKMIDEEFDLVSIYPELKRLRINTSGFGEFAIEYIERIQQLWQK